MTSPHLDDEVLDSIHLQVADAGVYSDSRKRQEPFAAFIEAYSTLQNALLGHEEAAPIDELREAALAAVPAVKDALQHAEGARVENDVVPDKALGDRSEPSPAPQRRVTRVVNVADLRPNSVNGTVFSASLAEESVRTLADDIATNGLRNPIEVNDNLVVLEGERRLRAIRMLGWAETEVVVVPGILSEQDIAAYILDAYSSVRDADLQEQVNLFQLALSVLRRRHGRPRGRPEKPCRNDTNYWGTSEIGREAARRAGFRSYETAQRASKVLREADEDIKEKLLAGEMTVNAAYETIRKPAGVEPVTPAEPTPEAESVNATPTDEASSADEVASAETEDATVVPVESGPPDGQQPGTPEPDEPVEGENDHTTSHAQDDVEVEPEVESEPPEASKTLDKNGFLAALRVVARGVRKKGPRTAAVVIRKLATTVSMDVFVPGEDHDENLAALRAILVGELIALTPAAAHEWIEELRGCLPKLE